MCALGCVFVHFFELMRAYVSPTAQGSQSHGYKTVLLSGMWKRGRRGEEEEIHIEIKEKQKSLENSKQNFDSSYIESLGL